MPERCVASTFSSFRNYLQSRQYKNHECQQSFFLLSLSPLPSLFSPVWFLGSWESKKPGFGVVPAKMGKSSPLPSLFSPVWFLGSYGQIFRSHLFKNPGATFSKIQVDIASNCCQMAKNDRILADERPLQHFLAILAHFMPINYLQSRQYKNHECQQSFFLLPSLPSLLFSLPCGF